MKASIICIASMLALGLGLLMSAAAFLLAWTSSIAANLSARLMALAAVAAEKAQDAA